MVNAAASGAPAQAGGAEGGAGAADGTPEAAADPLEDARGSAAATDVLRVTVAGVAPLSKRGTYRVAVTLYEGFQPMECSAGSGVRALTGRRALGMAPHGGDADPAAAAMPGVAATGGGHALRWGEAVTLRGARLSGASLLVFELHLAKPGVAGLPARESLVAWGFAPALGTRSAPPAGAQSVPLFRLPLLLGARRKFSYGGALIDFRVARFAGAPGGDGGPAAGARTWLRGYPARLCFWHSPCVCACDVLPPPGGARALRKLPPSC